jgi:hypothetical protein
MADSLIALLLLSLSIAIVGGNLGTVSKRCRSYTEKLEEFWGDYNKEQEESVRSQRKVL